MNNDDPLIRTDKLSKTYFTRSLAVPVLHDVDLEVQRGEFVAIMGPSGCGKSTLLYVLSGLTGATAGRIWIDRVELTALTDRQRTGLRRAKLGFVFQRFNLIPTLDAAGNIALAQQIRGRRPDRRGIRDLLARVGLADKADRLPAELSMGEQQRVAIARAVADKPALLLADEPTGNLDSATSQAVLGLLRQLNREDRQTILMITHNTEAAAVADRVLRMRDGRLLPPAPV